MTEEQIERVVQAMVPELRIAFSDLFREHAAFHIFEGEVMRYFNQTFGASSVSVLRDRVWIRPYHLIVHSGQGAGHRMFWTRKGAVKFAAWLSTIIADALDAVER